jgi:predicted kinase
VAGTLHVIHGFIGTGKTTFAKRLEQELPGIRFTPDEWMTTLYGTDPPEADFPTYFERVRQLMERTWLRCLELGEQVILDGGAWRRAERDGLRALAASVGATFIIYDLSVPHEVALSRVLRRNDEDPGHLHIAENTYWTLLRRFEPLAMDEPSLVPTTGVGRELR